MAVFDNLSVLLELKYLSFKEKKKVKSAVIENGGSICFVINKQCSLVVTSSVSSLSPSRLRSIQKHQTPVVGVDYLHDCVERGALLPVDQYKLDTSSAASPPLPVLPPAPLTQKESKVPTSETSAERSKGQAEPGGRNQRGDTTERGGNVLEKFRIFTETDSDLPAYPDDFQVAKYAIYHKTNSWCVLELQSVGTEQGRRYRVVRYRKDNASAKEAVLRDQLVFPSSSEEALDVFEDLRNSLEASGLKKGTDLPQQVQDLGSSPLQQLLLEEKLNTGSLSQEVGLFVELLWTEALGCLGNVLRVPIDKLSLNDVSRAEGFLLQAQKMLRAGDQSEASSLLEEVYTLLPHQDLQPPPPSTKLLSQKLDLCQLIRDVLNVSEMTLNSQAPSSVGKYRALRCGIETVPPGSSEFQIVTHLLHDSVQIQQIVRVSRGLELQTFRSDLGNIKPLLHSSSPSNFVGILSRGLLLPRVGVEHHGVERTDVGNLGSGIYFSNAVSTTLKYSKPSLTDGSWLLLVCDVALGRCKQVHKRDPTLTQAPEGHHSVHGVRRGRATTSEFEDDEYVVYSPDQIRLRYVVRFCVDGDQLKEFSPTVDVLSEPSPPSSHQELRLEDEEAEHVKNPLQEVTAGLLDSSGQQLPLQAVHVKCKLMDLLSQVIIFQKYTNQSFAPIEAKYVFPLDDSAAVCGFEAFINGKHVVGQVKEKEKARKEYKQAIEQGHGAYLMDQDAPDVFTISVGNLPPGATVLIKVTFVSELVVEDGSVLFSLPGSVAPWQQSAALNQTTQVAMEKVCVTDATGTREFTLDVSVEMPHEIRSLLCTTHKVRMKRTDCKAVLSVLPGQVMGSDGFQLSIALSEVHLPRMWVEKHPDKDSQACMLVFYPDFQISSSSAADEVILLLDTSESMRGEALRSAQRIALQVLRKLDHNLRLNIILFGTDHTEAFLTAQPLAQVHQAAESFIKRFSPVGGSTELWRPLRSLSLLPPSGGVRNLLLLSDGHIQNAAFTLQLLRDNAQHSRLFTCGLSPTANRHMLRALAQAGGGAYEFFDSKAKHSWAEKVASQVKRMLSPGCSSVSVKWQQFSPAAPPPLQAPKQLHALFSDCHTLVYGFVPHCTQATLLGNLCGVELETMVSTSELQKTRGTFLHKLAARALIRDYEDGSLETSEAEHEGKKAELKSFVIELSKEFSILSQFTSFVAIEERDLNQAEDGVTNVSKLIAEEDVDFLPYVSWSSENLDQLEMLNLESQQFCMGDVSPFGSLSDDVEQENDESSSEISTEDMDVGLSLTRCLPRHHTELMSPCEINLMNLTEDEAGPPRAEARRLLCFSAVKRRSSVVHPPPPPPPAVHPPPPLPAVHAPPPPLWEDLNIPYGSTSVPFSTLQGHGLSPEVQQGVRSPVIVSGPGFAGQPGPAVIGQHITEGFVFGQSPAGVGFGQSPAGVGFGQSAAGVGFGQSAAGVGFGQSAAGVGFGQSPAGVGFGQSAADVGFGQSAADVGFGQSAAGVGFGLNAADVGFGQSAAKTQLTADSYQAQRGTTDLSIPEAQILQSSGLYRNSFGNQHLSFGSFAEPLARPQPSALRLSSAFMPPRLGASSVGPPAAVGGLLELRKDKLRPKAAFFAASRLSSYQAAYVQGDVLPDRTVEPPKDVTEALSRERSFRTMNRSHFGALPRRLAIVGCSASESPSLPPPAETVTQDRPPTHDAPHQVLHEKIAGDLSKVHTVHSDASFHVGFPAPPSSERKLMDAELQLKWTKIFHLQYLDGFWDLTTELGDLINLNVDVFTNIFLKSKGIRSLGVKAHADILRMVATLLVLQLLRMEKVEEGKLLRSLFRLEETSPPRTGRLQQVKKAVDWVCLADRQYPCVCSRLEFGLNWESSTRQLLGFEDLPPFSPLRGLELQRPTPPLTVH